VLVVPLVVLAVFVGALTRATFGFGEAIVSMPLLALLPVGLHTSASLVGLAGLTVALLSLARGLHDVDRRMLVRLTLGTVVGIPLGVALLLLPSASPPPLGLPDRPARGRAGQRLQLQRGAGGGVRDAAPLAVATLAGHRLHRRIPGDRFARYVYLLVLGLGAVLAVRGLTAG
jgi:uncharacterized membrane protein YfcA